MKCILDGGQLTTCVCCQVLPHSYQEAGGLWRAAERRKAVRGTVGAQSGWSQLRHFRVSFWKHVEHFPAQVRPGEIPRRRSRVIGIPREWDFQFTAQAGYCGWLTLENFLFCVRYTKIPDVHLSPGEPPSTSPDAKKN